ncbi:hypothetical protein AB6A40_007875 [Gnathostoma spinigerum]|uniref:Uncharacterized protein n=1 Tax=Gnathostoma spinigerum TaxID=75299 RepID=A0ABD6EPG6_9BILA
MLRRLPTEIKLKADDVEQMGDAIKELTEKVKSEIVVSEEVENNSGNLPPQTESSRDAEIRRRIGAPLPRIRMSIASDRRPIS